MKHTALEKAKKIKLFILDVDGILTDGKIYVLPDGESFVAFDVRDGVGIKNLQALGITIAIISGRNTKSVRHRLEQLDIRHIFLGVDNKLAALRLLKNELQLSAENIAYMGDDLADIPPMENVGFAVTVPNAMDNVKKISHYCTQRFGGDGAVREICD